MIYENVKVGEGVTLLRVGDIDSNIYLIGKELLIDTGTGLSPELTVQALHSAGASPDAIKRIVLTHAHFDHIGGIALFKDAKVMIHKEDAAVIESGDKNGSAASSFCMQMRPRKVDSKLEGGDVIKSGGMRLEVVHTPGHTKGSICLYDRKRKVLFSGDTVFADGFGRIDLPGGSLTEIMKSLERLARLDVDRILPGHGSVVWSGGSGTIKSLLQCGS